VHSSQEPGPEGLVGMMSSRNGKPVAASECVPEYTELAPMEALRLSKTVLSEKDLEWRHPRLTPHS
jgi:hypothetical protein